MSVTESDLKFKKAEYAPTNDSNTVGGEKTATDVAQTIGSIFHVRTANPSEEDATKYQFKKIFIVNENEDTDLTDAKVWLSNALDDVSVNGVVTVTSSSEDDDETMKIKVVGEDADELVQTEEIILDGTSGANGAKTFSKIFWVELRSVSSGSLVNSNGDITIEVNSTEIGEIPTSQNCALAIVDIGLVATLDDSGTTTNAITAPDGIVFTRPRTFETGLSVANSGTLTSEAGQGVWWKQSVEGGLVPSSELTIAIAIQGSTT